MTPEKSQAHTYLPKVEFSFAAGEHPSDIGEAIGADSKLEASDQWCLYFSDGSCIELDMTGGAVCAHGLPEDAY